MEEACVPTIWIGNRIDGMDPATLRRFDFTLELGPPPESQRRRQLEAAFAQSALPADVADAIVTDARATPAHVAMAARVASLVGEDPVRQARAVRAALSASLALAGPSRATTRPMDDAYDLAFVHANVDLATLAAAIARRPDASLCLYGPPGTGKTAFVHHLARRLDVPLHALRMSDLLGKYLGETEQRIARAFSAAQSAGALLFLDEVDGLLRERSGADRRWEVTQVNELLVQLEGFRGVFACATNLEGSLDAASLRRFSFKVELLPLRLEQRVGLLQRLGGFEELDDATTTRLARLPALCAGDYAAVRRRLELLDEARRLEPWLAGLEAEHAMKRTARTARIGFGA